MTTQPITVLNPTGKVHAQVKSRARRVADLSGKRVGVLWNEKPNGDILLDEIFQQLRKRFRVEKAVYHWKDAGRALGQDALTELIEKSDVVINGLAD